MIYSPILGPQDSTIDWTDKQPGPTFSSIWAFKKAGKSNTMQRRLKISENRIMRFWFARATDAKEAGVPMHNIAG